MKLILVVVIGISRVVGTAVVESSAGEVFSDGFETADTSRWSTNAACAAYTSTEEEFSPIQTTGAGLPPHADDIVWSHPAWWTWIGSFSGTPGSPASHEGTDYVHDISGVTDVPITAAADGQVVAVRLGCPQSSAFSPNTALRECGAGWGNHVVVLHGHQVLTRYAHLEPGRTAVTAGMHVQRGQLLGMMGNSGRSDTRHLHFELGTASTPFDPCGAAQSMDLVFDSELLTFSR
jgi:murein DD-endopeptidase MepM/ murein hydrolase activator NlpD